MQTITFYGGPDGVVRETSWFEKPGEGRDVSPRGEREGGVRMDEGYARLERALIDVAV